MGGFAFDLSGDSPFIARSAYQTLGPDGVLLLARAGHLPDISERDIRDKSKTDGLGQFLACSQAMWLVVQCIARFRLGLFITTLELNTIAHVFCALITSVLWWNKPFQVQEPTLIHGKAARQLCAYMWMTSNVSATTLNIHDRWTEMESVSHRPDWNPRASESPEQPEPIYSVIAPSSKKEYDLSEGQRLPGSDFFVAGNSKRFYMATYFSEPPHIIDIRGKDRALPKVIHFRPLDAERWRLALAAMSNPAYNKVLPYTQDRRSFIVDRPANFPEGWFPEEWKRFTGFTWRECIPLAPVAAAYAGAHAIAWNYNFATPWERAMWRLSVFFLSIVFGLILICGTYSALREYFYKRRGKEPPSWKTGKGLHTFVVSIFLGPVVFCLIRWYPLARGYVVVESFIGLRYLPPDAYLVPQWAQLIPR